MKLSAKRIAEGEEYPKGYGFAYFDGAAMLAVCYPLGINWVIWLFHHFVLWLKNPPPHELEMKLYQEYRRGYIDGRRRLISTEARNAALGAEVSNGFDP